MLKKSILENIKNFILNNDNFIITSHVNFDGDSIGSELAVAEILKILNKKFYIYNNDKCTESISFLPNLDLINNSPPVDLKNYKNLIVLDAAFTERIGVEVFKTLHYIQKQNIIIIDHHPNEKLNDKSYINPAASSTSELIYYLIEHLNLKINSNIALYLYVGIVTDTFSFRQTNTTSTILNIASKLINKLPIPYTKMIEYLYESNRFPALKLLGELLNNVKIDYESGLIYGYLTREMFDKHNANDTDTENFINHLRSVNNIQVACIIRETEKNDIKVNLRAKEGNINLIPFAKKFGGGGHVRASGFSLPMDDINKTINLVINELKKYIQNEK